VAVCFIALLSGGYLVYLIETKHWTGASVLGVALLTGWFVLEMLAGILLFTRAEFTAIDQETDGNRNT
jgi:hypothetical protein